MVTSTEDRDDYGREAPPISQAEKYLTLLESTKGSYGMEGIRAAEKEVRALFARQGEPVEKDSPEDVRINAAMARHHAKEARISLMRFEDLEGKVYEDPQRIALIVGEIRTHYAAGNQPVEPGSPLDTRIETAAINAHSHGANRLINKLENAPQGVYDDYGSILDLHNFVAKAETNLRGLYAAAGTPVQEGSELDGRIDAAAKRAHGFTAELLLKDLERSETTYNARYMKDIETDIRDHYAAAGTRVEKGSALDDHIAATAQRAIIPGTTQSEAQPQVKQTGSRFGAGPKAPG